MDSSSKFTFFQAPVMAFFNQDLYRDVAKNWTGCGALYIFMLSSIAWLISCMATFYPFFQIAGNKDVSTFCNQLPKMTIAEGKMTIDKQCPYDVKEPKSGEVIMRFATDRVEAKAMPDDPPIVVTQTAMVSNTPSALRPTSGGSEPAPGSVMKFDQLEKIAPKIDLDGPSVLQAINQFVLILPIAVLFVAWPFIFLGHLIQLLIFGGIGMLIASMMEKQINFETSMRIAAIAISPGIVISVLLNLVKLPVPATAGLLALWPFASIAVAIVYSIMIMRALPTPELQQQL